MMGYCCFSAKANHDNFDLRLFWLILWTLWRNDGFRFNVVKVSEGYLLFGSRSVWSWTSISLKFSSPFFAIILRVEHDESIRGSPRLVHADTEVFAKIC